VTIRSAVNLGRIPRTIRSAAKPKRAFHSGMGSSSLLGFRSLPGTVPCTNWAFPRLVRQRHHLPEIGGTG
jgi:hypothetical protein